MTVLSGQSIMKSGAILSPEPRTEVEYRGQRYTYGCGPAGYDLRLDCLEAQAIHRAHGDHQYYLLRPGEFRLASALEKFTMPKDLIGIVHDKSSWARRGLAVQNTVIEPGWSGYLTLELTNHSREEILLPHGAGICQVLFHRLDEETYHPYDGKYQNQDRGPQEAL